MHHGFKRNCGNDTSIVNLEFLYLSNDVIVGIVEPLVEGDETVVVLVHVGEVLPALGKSSLKLKRKTGSK